MADTERLAGKIGLVTGGASGVGLATAKELVAQGAEVIITGQRQEEVDEAARVIGKGVTGIRCTISELAELGVLFDTIEKEKKRLDFVVAHAGSGELLPLPEFVPLDRVTECHYDKCFATKLKGTFFTVQRALSLMSLGGSIVIDGTLVSERGIPAFGLYAATKAAMHAFARAWSADLKGRRIRVNLATPFPLEERTAAEPLPGIAGEQLARYRQGATLHASHLNETVRAIIFLVSNDSDEVTGTEVFVDGGVIPL